LLKAFDNAYSESNTEFEKQAEQKKAAFLKKNEEELEITKKQNKLELDFQKWKNNKIDKELKSIGELEVEKLKKEFQEKITENALFSKMIETKGFEHTVIQIERYKFLESKLLAKDHTDFEKFKDQTTKG